MLMSGQRFSNISLARLEAQRVANELECNVPIYSKGYYYYHWDGDDLMGTVEILPTPSGNILKELLKAGILLGISSRGMGSVEPRSGGGVTVGDDFELIGWDFVSNPSTHGAFMTPMNESKQI